MGTTTIVVLAILVILALVLVGVYNRLQVLDNRVDNAFAQIDVQLKRRNDLIPNLVNTVKGYAAHESGIFDRVSAARERMVNAGSVAEKAQASGELSAALGRLFAVAEAYPDLKANQNFLSLQSELSDIENKIAYSRQFYNDTVLELNNAVTTVPGVFVAGFFGKKERIMFEASDVERGVPQVSF
jgi:LemA protein